MVSLHGELLWSSGIVTGLAPLRYGLNSSFVAFGLHSFICQRWVLFAKTWGVSFKWRWISRCHCITALESSYLLSFLNFHIPQPYCLPVSMCHLLSETDRAIWITDVLRYGNYATQCNHGILNLIVQKSEVDILSTIESSFTTSVLLHNSKFMHSCYPIKCNISHIVKVL